MKSIKVILLAPVVFDNHNNDLVEKVILKLDKIKDKNIFSKDTWESLDTEDGYLKNVDGALDIRDAILKERNLNPQIYKKFSEPYHSQYEGFPLEVNAKLIVNQKHNFLMLFEFSFTDMDLDECDTFIKNLMDNRNLFEVTGCSDFYHKIKMKSMDVINDFIKKILHSSEFKISQENFTMDSSYPLLFINGFDKIKNLSHLFSNEEDAQQRDTSSLLTNDYENAFVHIGWNYGVVKDLPKNVSQKYLCMLIFLQLKYYLLRFYKNYFQKKIENLSKQSSFNEIEIKNFDRLKILYHKEYLAYITYKSGLYPKYYKEFVNIETLWHMHEDVTFIEKTFEVQNEYINKHFQLETDRTSRNLNYGIAVIGLIQIFALYSVFNDYASLKSDVKFAEYLEQATTSIAATVSMIVLVGITLYVRKRYRK